MPTTPSPAQHQAQQAWRQLHGDAGHALLLAQAAAQRAANDDDAAGAAWAQLALGFHRLYFAAPAEAATVLEDSARRFATLQDQRAGEILACTGHARALWRLGRVQQAMALLLPLRDEGLQLLAAEQRGVLLNAIAGCWSALGDSAQAFAYMYQALRDTGPELGHGFDTALYCNLSHELIELGDRDEALRQVERGLERMQGLQNGRLLTVLLVNRTICLTELGRAAEALPDVRRLAAAEADPSGRALLPMHFEAQAICALQAGDLPLADHLLARCAAPQLPDEFVERAMAEALRQHRHGDTAAALRTLDAVAPQLLAEGDAKPSLRMRCEHARLRANLLEAAGDLAGALAALRDWQRHQAERARLASRARQQAAMLQTELLQMQQRLEENEAKRQQAERARAELAELNAALSRKIAEVEALQCRLQELATQDALTGLANRRHLNDTLPATLALAQRDATPLAVVVIDLDHFKRVNDNHGHPVGDQLLAAFGLLLREHLRRSDLAFRYGGEEFCLLMPHTPAADAQLKVQSLLAAWRAQRFTIDGGVTLTGQSFSAGITDSLLGPASPGDLLRAADQLLLLAKRAQRGSVLIPGSLP
jgi:diguanylate cyclase (GGDEF)-like protein